ncbi:MAG: hypothetical protein LBD74_03395, partial [Spirochaetaceae bacterium]|nr:hypothetical protein [Spirochaetaceae bacterium]
MYFLLALSLTSLVFTGCTKDIASAPRQDLTQAAEVLPQAEEFAEEEKYREQAARLAASWDDRLLAAQVLMSGIDGKTPRLSEAMNRLLLASPPGGIMLFKYNLDTDADTIRSFLETCASYTAANPGQGAFRALPFIAVDHEGGAVHRFPPEVVRGLPEAAWFWETAQTRGKEYAL